VLEGVVFQTMNVFSSGRNRSKLFFLLQSFKFSFYIVFLFY